jgi:hypothetical protein
MKIKEVVILKEVAIDLNDGKAKKMLSEAGANRFMVEIMWHCRETSR